MALVDHYGKRHTYEEVIAVPTPEPEGIWHPISHEAAIGIVEDQFSNRNLEWLERDFVLGGARGEPDGDRLFGVWEFPGEDDDHGFEVGFRHSHDKSVANSLCAGPRVFVCSNLAFTAAHVVSRKHTVNLLQELPDLVGAAVDKVFEERRRIKERFDRYKAFEFTANDWEKFCCECFRQGVLAPSKFHALDSNWENPPHEEHAGHTAWSAYNAVTETLKLYSSRNAIQALPGRTTALHQVTDALVGINN